MKPSALLTAAAVLVLAAGCAGDTTTGSSPSWDVGCEDRGGKTTAADFEEFTLACLADGKKHKLGELGDRPMVITLWATWCGPCRSEAPAFKQFQKKLGKKVTLMGVDTKDDETAARDFAAEAGWGFPSVVDDTGAVMKSQGITALPATFFIDADGKTVMTFNEGELTTKKLLRAADEQFGVTP